MKKLALLLFAALGVVQAASGAPFSVTNANDNGAGSLRQAIIDANNAAGADTITFDSTFFSTPRMTNQPNHTLPKQSYMPRSADGISSPAGPRNCVDLVASS